MKKSKLILSLVTLVCLGLGFLFGFVAPEFSKGIKFIGDWYVNILKILIGPIIFVSIFLNIVSKKRNGSLIVLKTVCMFICMFVVTFLLTSVIVAIAKPGADFVIDNPNDTTNYANFGLAAILNNLIHANVKDLFYGKNLLFVIILALIMSLLMSVAPNKNNAIKMCQFVKKYLNYALQFVLILTPIAVVSLVSNVVVTYGSMIITVGLKYILFAWGCSILTILLVMVLPVWLIAKVNPITYIRKVAKVWLISLSTCSSVATLPHTIKCCNEDFDVDEKITDVVVPLGCTIHMCGGAVSFALLGLFVSQMSGFTNTFGTFLLMILCATLINMAAPGIPGGGVVIGLSYLTIFNLPITGFYGFYSGIYKLLDMPYTTLNVTGDISANIILNKFEKKEEVKVEESSIEESEIKE